MDAPPRGERGGSPPRKNDQNRREVAGQNIGQILSFSMEETSITMLNNAQSSLSIGFARDTILYILYNLMLRAIFADYR